MASVSSEEENIDDHDHLQNAIKETEFENIFLAPLNTSSLTPINEVHFTIHNIVATVNFKTKLNLQDITLRTRNTEYNPKRFPGLVMRLENPKSTALIFSTGKAVVSGCKSVAASNLSARKIGKILYKLGTEDLGFADFKVCNMVALYDVKFPINLENFAERHLQFTRYEPELFPALIYRVIRPRVTALIFVSGKALIVGAKSLEEIRAGIEFLMPLIWDFRKRAVGSRRSILQPEKEI